MSTIVKGPSGFEAGDAITVVQPIEVEGVGRLEFPVPRPSQLNLENAKGSARRATRLKPTVLKQTSNSELFFDFMGEAMAAILLLHAALDNYANESLPDDATYEKDGRLLTRREIQDGTGIEMRLSRVLSTVLQKLNLRTADPSLWDCLMRLKDLRDDIQHMSGEDAYSHSESEATVLHRLMHEDLLGLADCVEKAMNHYGLDVPRRMADVVGDS